jgi:threonine dehydratase
VHHDGAHNAVSWFECLSPQVVQTTDIIDVTVASVEEAVRTLHDVAHYTPVLTSCQLDALSGARVFLKCENFSAAV